MEKKRCFACPRQCGAERETKHGFCGTGENPRIARIGLHAWEEPCISYGKGSGTVFFSGCNLRCVYCQNHEISQEGGGVEIRLEELCREILALQERGAVNLNLVTPSHQTELLAIVLQELRPKLKIPVIYNSSGYDRVESLRKLEGLVDCYLPDLKYYSAERSARYSAAADYFTVAKAAVAEMVRQVGMATLNREGHLTRGVMIRHLVLPAGYHDSIDLLDALAAEYSPTETMISLMCQYYPTYRAAEYPEIDRRVTSFEYKKVVEHAQDLGFVRGYRQDRSAAVKEYRPEFDYRGGHVEE